ncbi:MAG TPA: hypothetical protein VFA66_06870 [Gaiellaceae bacterium]|nr:hypothetical protein [Gaiellaceae bacterium]
MNVLLATLSAAAVVAVPAPRELPQSPSWRDGKFGPLAPGATYAASLVDPRPTIRAMQPGWAGTQVVSHPAGKIRYESAVFLGHGGEIDLVGGPALTKSPQEAIDWVWNRRYERPFGPLKSWRIAGRNAVAFDGTNTSGFELTLVGRNPPEVQMDRGQSFRLAAFAVRGHTVVLAVRSFRLQAFLPRATRLLSSLRFPTT